MDVKTIYSMAIGQHSDYVITNLDACVHWVEEMKKEKGREEVRMEVVGERIGQGKRRNGKGGPAKVFLLICNH